MDAGAHGSEGDSVAENLDGRRIGVTQEQILALYGEAMIHIKVLEAEVARLQKELSLVQEKATA